MTDQQPAIAAELLELLVCPVDHAKVDLTDSSLICTACGRVYPIVDGIPNMVVNE